MGYLLVENFKDGLDARKMVLTTKAGALLTLTNAHLTRGAEIEKRKAFVPYATLPAGMTVGMQSAVNNLYTFGSSSPPVMPPNVTYQRLQHPSSVDISSVLFNENFNGKIYAIARFMDGSIYHYYDGNRVTSWDALATTAIGQTTVATALSLLISQEAPFTSTSLGPIISITENNNDVPFTVTTVATNGGAISDETMVVALVQASDPSNPQISTVTIGGTVEAGDQYQITLEIPSISYVKTFTVTGLSTTMPTVVKTFGTKMYAEAASLLYFSEINDPTTWGTNINGSGVINMSNQDAGSEVLTGLGVYQGKLAIYARRTVQIWSMDADPTKNVKGQVLNNIGTNAPRSVVSFGDVDIFFASDTGIRSLRARDASNAATVSDVGTNLDPLYLANNNTLTEAVKNNAVGIIEPIDGRYWLAQDENVYVYSFFPTPGVAAWSIYQPGFVISHLAYANGRVYARSGDTIYIYGGLDNNTYDNCHVIVDLPYLDAGKPATEKTLTGLDVGLEGTVDVYIGADVNYPTFRDLIGTLTGSTYGLTNILCNNIGTHFGVRFESQYNGYLRIGNCAIHFTPGDAA